MIQLGEVAWGLLVCEHTPPSTGQNTKKHTRLGKDHRVLRQEGTSKALSSLCTWENWVLEKCHGSTDSQEELEVKHYMSLPPMLSTTSTRNCALQQFNPQEERTMWLGSWESLGSALKDSKAQPLMKKQGVGWKSTGLQIRTQSLVPFLKPTTSMRLGKTVNVSGILWPHVWSES